MADPNEVNRAADDVLEALKANVSQEVLYRVWRNLPDAIGNQTTDLMQLEVVYNTDDEEDEDREVDGFECPHCLKTIAYDVVEMVDMDIREIGSHSVEEETLYFDADVDSNYEDVTLTCGLCHLPVALPKGWVQEWS